MMVPGNAVLTVEAAEGNADETAIADVRNAQCAAARLAIRILDRTEGLFFLVLFVFFAFLFCMLGFFEGPQRCRFGKSGNLDIVCRTFEVVGGERKGTRAELRPEAAVAIPGRRVHTQGNAGREWLVNALRDESGVDNVDDAAGCAAAIKQGRGTANDLDPVGEEPVNGHLVVFTQRRSIERIQPVGQNPDTLAILAADDRS